MCLILQKDESSYVPWKISDAFYKKLKKNGKTTAWKQVKVARTSLPIYYCNLRDESNIPIVKGKIYTPYLYYEIKPGWFKSNRIVKDLDDDEKITGSVNQGIHVFTARNAYWKLTEYWKLTDLPFVKVTVYLKDLVAIGMYKEAVFTKVFIPKSEICKITKNK